MLKYLEFITEDGFATMGNTGGMGSIISAQPGSSPGEQGTKGSGDIGCSLGTYTKNAPTLKKKKKVKSFKDFKK